MDPITATLLFAAVAGGFQAYQANRAVKSQNKARRIQAQAQADERAAEIGAAQQIQNTALSGAASRNRRVRSQGIAGPSNISDSNGFMTDNANSLSGTF